jgi:hypothetical protein
VVGDSSAHVVDCNSSGYIGGGFTEYFGIGFVGIVQALRNVFIIML